MPDTNSSGSGGTTVTLPANARTDITDQMAVDAYRGNGRSVWKAAAVLGISGMSVQRRLVRAGEARSCTPISDAEVEVIRAHYSRPIGVNLDDLAAELGRSKHLLCRKARQLGLTTTKHVIDWTTRERPGSGKDKWKNNPHPRGALGLKHTPEAKAIISAKSKLAWATAKTFGTGLMSETVRQGRSDKMSKWKATQPAENAYSRAKGGRRADVGPMYFRSAWEANYARYLNWLITNGEITSWEYEPVTFWFEAIKRGVRSYKPDFRIVERGHTYFVEVKGWMDAKSKTKLQGMKKYHPDVEVRLVGAKEYAAIARSVAKLVAGWE